MSLNEHIGQQIKKARKLARLTQKELGDRLGKSGATIAYLEQGKRRVSPNVLDRIASETGQTLSFFYAQNDTNDHSHIGQQLHQLQQQLGQLSGVLDKMHDRIRESEETARLVFEQASDAMVLLDVSGEVLDVNHAFLRLMAFQRQQIVGKVFWKVVSAALPQEVALYQQAFLEAVQKGETLEVVRHELTNAKGEVVLVETTSRFLRRDQEPWAILASMRPVREVSELRDLVGVSN